MKFSKLYVKFSKKVPMSILTKYADYNFIPRARFGGNDLTCNQVVTAAAHPLLSSALRVPVKGLLCDVMRLPNFQFLQKLLAKLSRIVNVATARLS